MELAQQKSEPLESKTCEEEWKAELTDLEMIKAAKLILLNKNPLFYLRRISQRRSLPVGPILEEIPSWLVKKEHASHALQPKVDDIAHLRYDNKIKSTGDTGSDGTSLPTSIMALLAQRWGNENTELNTHHAHHIHHTQSGTLKPLAARHGGLGSHHSIKDIQAKTDSFRKAIKFFEKNRNTKHFSDRFLEKVDLAFEDDPSLLYLRVLGTEKNIHGKVLDNQMYHVFDFFEFRKQNDFSKMQNGAKMASKFFRENYYEANELNRVTEVLFYANRLGGNLWKIQRTNGSHFDVWLQKETNANSDNLHFKFGVCFAYPGPGLFHFRVCNLAEEVVGQLGHTQIYSKVNGGAWLRNIPCKSDGKHVCFDFVKHHGSEQVEFSLFFPYNSQAAFEAVSKRFSKRESVALEVKNMPAKQGRTSVVPLMLPEIIQKGSFKQKSEELAISQSLGGPTNQPSVGKKMHLKRSSTQTKDNRTPRNLSMLPRLEPIPDRAPQTTTFFSRSV
jgi:hypothetical protein